MNKHNHNHQNSTSTNVRSLTNGSHLIFAIRMNPRIKLIVNYANSLPLYIPARKIPFPTCSQMNLKHYHWPIYACIAYTFTHKSLVDDKKKTYTHTTKTYYNVNL